MLESGRTTSHEKDVHWAVISHWRAAASQRPEPGDEKEGRLRIDEIDEALIERYVRYRSTLSEAEVSAVEDVLKKSRTARLIASFYER